MGLFDKFKKKETSVASEQTQNNPANQAPATSLIWLPKIYEQFTDQANKDDVYGKKIPALIKTYKSLFNNNAPKEEINKAFVELRNEVIRTLYIVPFHYDSGNEFENDTVVHCTQLAANKFNIESIIYRCQNMTMEEMSKLAWVKDNATNTLTVDFNWWDITRISGSEGYHFEDGRYHGTMYPYIGKKGTDEFFLCFTGIDECLKVYSNEKNLHIALFTINDIVKYMSASNDVQGLIINPHTESHCFIGKEVF